VLADSVMLDTRRASGFREVSRMRTFRGLFHRDAGAVDQLLEDTTTYDSVFSCEVRTRAQLFSTPCVLNVIVLECLTLYCCIIVRGLQAWLACQQLTITPIHAVLYVHANGAEECHHAETSKHASGRCNGSFTYGNQIFWDTVQRESIAVALGKKLNER
jgi:hypothetical protein